MNEGGWIIVLLAGFSALIMVVGTIFDFHRNAEIQSLKIACAAYQAEISTMKAMAQRRR